MIEPVDAAEKYTRRRLRILLLAFALCTQPLAAEPPDRPSYAPTAGSDFPREVFWGDTHLHTSASPDAFRFGNRAHDRGDAYRFAQGEELEANNGMAVRLRRPLDFLVVSDHAEYLGVLPGLQAGDALLADTDTGSRWTAMMQAGQGDQVFEEFFAAINGLFDAEISMDFTQSVWFEVTAAADRFNDPGVFTAFSGYEWTSMPKGNNLHRVVIFRDGSKKTNQVMPFSALDSDEPEDLWKYLANYEATTGGQVLAIPHNSNLSGGLMFALEDSKGRPISKEYAETRSRWEPLVEATQFKGDSETHPFFSPDDAFADYETWDWANAAQTIPHEDWMSRFEYVRGALKSGLEIDARVGANPYRLGMIGSTDSHTSYATASEDNFWGKFSNEAPAPGRVDAEGDVPGFSWRYASSGYAAVWARANTREELFAAMKRRETYATTGPRMVVRFFGGWSFDASDAHRPDPVQTGYRMGVPMGGTLTRREGNPAPAFLVVAAKDPDGANLDRVQIVKGWLEKDGTAQERVFDVALSDGRQPNGRKVTPVGSTVDEATATYKNTIGDAQLAAVWRDPDFDPNQSAFYYARVIEIPTPRWTAYDAVFFGLELADDVPTITQERAYTSPIWYDPGVLASESAPSKTTKQGPLSTASSAP
ncbi:DUF3604 domain-containing protein [Myxococcota bacterium]|nr:DUF3604 domain-containing protein [Myxococcota bacterium]